MAFSKSELQQLRQMISFDLFLLNCEIESLQNRRKVLFEMSDIDDPSTSVHYRYAKTDSNRILALKRRRDRKIDLLKAVKAEIAQSDSDFVFEFSYSVSDISDVIYRFLSKIAMKITNLFGFIR